MGVLGKWQSLVFPPKTLDFPYLELIGLDFEPPIISGSGQIRMPTATRIEFVLEGRPQDIRHALSAIRRQQSEPFNIHAQFRLKGTDDTGTEWSIGWTSPHFDPSDGSWTVTGEVDALNSLVVDRGNCSQPSTEVLFMLPPFHPAARGIQQLVVTLEQGRPRRERKLELLDSTLHFQYDPALGALRVTAKHSQTLPSTYTENWLGEPLRILLGQLIYPRLVARNLGDGSTMISVRRTPGYTSRATSIAMWQGEHAGEDREGFWAFYVDLLTLIARAQGFEAHNITRLYEEVIQASRGSRWVWAMACASAIESLVKMLEPSGEKRSDADVDAVAELVTHIKNWSGSTDLKAGAIDAVRRTLRTTPASALRRLVEARVISRAQSDAWKEVRNRVAHGNLIFPYSTEEEESKFALLTTTMHSLTRELAKRSAAI